jgi:hypothetical protein
MGSQTNICLASIHARTLIHDALQQTHCNENLIANNDLQPFVVLSGKYLALKCRISGRVLSKAMRGRMRVLSV